ncbi:hypothetical protein [Dyadobacter sp. 3J3]|uniref:hypothetical protein n=1 Tax=Dyadobacter sp. 3J3 TaxID=2606600 RepID=UPI00135AC229|nr:hypothetical protein [Dyadobacter sp. 3J3]
MENGDITLISGIYEFDDARDVLLSLINQKISFHNLRNFSMQERFGINDSTSESNIEILIKARLEIMDYLVLAKSLGCLLSVQSTISIQLLPPTPNIN